MNKRSKSAIKWLVITAILFVFTQFGLPQIRGLFGRQISPLLGHLTWAILAAVGIWLCTVIFRNSKRAKELRSSCDGLSSSFTRLEASTRNQLEELKKSVAELRFESLKKEGKFRFTKDMPLTEALAVHPDVAKTLFTRGLACISCPSAAVETIEQAAQVHGMDVQPILDDLNKLLDL